MRRAPLLLVLAALAAPLSAQHTFAVGDSAFLLDGKPFQILAGEMHYPRIPREYWRQRLRMAKAMGLNTVSAYVFWNVEEPNPGVFDFSGNADVAEFVREAGQEGLWVVLRPGPYVCAEWEFGGYPWWLLRTPAVRVRDDNPDFLAAVGRYFDALGRQLAPLQVTHGGPIVMVQVENEYGSYGADKVYLGKLRDALRHAGFDVPLYTADGSDEVPAGSVTGALPELTGGYIGNAGRLARTYHPAGGGPTFLAEFYPGWLDHWGEPHQRRPAAAVAAAVDSVITAGASISIYMFHGGTNWGFWNGANYDDHYQPQPTSYDYDAPLDESGRPTPKYYALRDVIRRHLPPGSSLPGVPAVPSPIAVPRFPLPERAGLWSLLGPPVPAAAPRSMEDLGQGYGYVLYRTRVARAGSGVLKLYDLRDYGVVFVDGKRVAELDRRDHQDSALVTFPHDSSRLDILVENTGRINYGSRIPDNRQGITDSVTFQGAALQGWEMYSLPFDHPARARFRKAAGTGPALYRGTFTLARTGDTFLDLRGWGKGNVWVNGHNLGRYWYIGPQQTLYVPGPWLRAGANEVVVLDLEDGGTRTLAGLAAPILDQLTPDRNLRHP